MEVITFESKAYKELDNKITAIANFIFNQLEAKAERMKMKFGWIVTKFAHFFKSVTVPYNAYGLMVLLPTPT